MAGVMRKCVALAPEVNLPHPPDEISSPRFPGRGKSPSVLELFQSSRTDWIRLAVDWPAFQPDSADKVNADAVTALDEDIAAARSVGLRVILVSGRYPYWSNGTQSLLVPAGQPGAGEPIGIGDPITAYDECVKQALRQRFGPQADVTVRARPPEMVKDILLNRFPGGVPYRSVDANGNVSCPKPEELFRFAVGPGSDWYYWIRFLAARYSPEHKGVPDRYADQPLPPQRDPAHMFCDVLEFVNEPNLAQAGWPQRDKDDQPLSHKVVTEMFRSARQIRNTDLAAARGPFMAGPATSDLESSGDGFTENLLRRLKSTKVFPGRPKSRDFPRGTIEAGPNFIWTHHCYHDVWHPGTHAPRTVAPNKDGQYGRRGAPGAAPPTVNRAALVRNKLYHNGWAGWPNGDPRDPRVWLTEGGVWRATLRGGMFPTGLNVGARYDREQERLLEAMWEHLLDENELGRGISMFTQYLFYTKADYDSGLLYRSDDNGAVLRPAYHTWAALRKSKLRGPRSGWLLDNIG